MYNQPQPQRPKLLPHEHITHWMRRYSRSESCNAGSLSLRTQILIASIIAILACSMCSYASIATSMQQQSPTAVSTPTATTAATTAPVAQVTQEATPTATDTPTATPTPSPTPKPTPSSLSPGQPPTPRSTPVPTRPTPTPKPCADPCNPWGYSFSTGSLIYSPASSFCSYFSCIDNFWNGRGYVNECQDGEYSKSGGIRGDCSYHGGMLRPLYSH